MKRIVYLSRAAHAFSAAELTALLNKSRKNNHSSGLSGLLVFHKDLFFQVLEGPAAQVDACYGKIAADPRHCDLTMLEVSEVDKRAFPQWKMGFSKPSELRPLQQNAVFSLFDLVPSNSEYRGDDPSVRAQVRGFLASFETLKEYN